MNISSAIFRQQNRQIGMLIPSVVISEKHTDTLEITEHPVEKPTSQGASGFVSDHAWKRPGEVVIECGFESGGNLLDLIDTSKAGITLGLSPQETYQKLLDLQESRLPIDVITGKRSYKNMLIRSIDVTTDKTTEYVLSCTLTLREVIISSTYKIQVADKSKMRFGVSTSAVQNTGVKTPVPVNESVLKKHLPARK